MSQHNENGTEHSNETNATMSNALFTWGLISGVGGVAIASTTGAIGAASATSLSAVLVGMGLVLAAVSLLSDLNALRTREVIGDE